MRWSYGVVSVASRKDTLLQQTIQSLAAAGFDKPRIFIDNAHGDDPAYVFRGPRINEYGNWMLAAAELYFREPKAERYAIFQDDILAYLGLREYLESQPFPERAYWNLFTFMENEDVVKGQPEGWYESAELDNEPGRQTGRGALALVFDNHGMISMLSHRNMYARARHPIGNYNTDGAVVATMNSMGFREYVHNPSLVQHTGYPSTVVRMDDEGKPFDLDLPQSSLWLGERFNATWIPQKKRTHTTDDVVNRLPLPRPGPLPAPKYRCSSKGVKVGLCVPSMRRHMTDEGIQIYDGLREGGNYLLYGHAEDEPHIINETDVLTVLMRSDPGIVVIQDKREYDGGTTIDEKNEPSGQFDPRDRFTNVSALKSCDDVFKVTILKDAHQRPEYHRDAAREIDAHAWIVYYHPKIVAALAPYVRPEHLIRTYHTIDPANVPEFNAGDRLPCILSGATSMHYPIRRRLTAAKLMGELPGIECLSHPGYHCNGAETPDFLKVLSQFKVAICTASVYGYALRKIVEATAAGCIVVTDLPEDDVLPEIDGNLVRVHPRDTVRRIEKLVAELAEGYDPAKQREWAAKALRFYDYREMGKRLSEDIDNMRGSYPCAST